jgi:hypothetical protein
MCLDIKENYINNGIQPSGSHNNTTTPCILAGYLWKSRHLVEPHGRERSQDRLGLLSLTPWSSILVKVNIGQKERAGAQVHRLLSLSVIYMSCVGAR